MSAERSEADAAQHPLPPAPVRSALRVTRPDANARIAPYLTVTADEGEDRLLVGSLERWLDLNA